MNRINIHYTPKNHYAVNGTITYELRYQHQKATIPTTINITEQQWDTLQNDITYLTNPLYGLLPTPIPDHITKDTSQLIIYSRISSDITLLNTILYRIDNSPFKTTQHTIQDIIAIFQHPTHHIDLLEFIQTLIEEFNTQGRYGTAQNYQRLHSSLHQFLQKLKLPIRALNQDLVNNYNTYLCNKNLKRNSISFYMRNLRATYNKAKERHLIDNSTPQNLFKQVYTGIDSTTKRAITLQQIHLLRDADLTQHPNLAFSRDLFLFSFYTRGMPFVDIAYLTHANIIDNHLIYRRHKTSQTLRIHLEPCILTLLGRYSTLDPNQIAINTANNTENINKTEEIHATNDITHSTSKSIKDTNRTTINNNKYLFPILTNKDPEESYKEYQRALVKHNAKLAELSTLLNLPIKLTSYTPRHSWATIARDNSIPLSIISAGMGHTSQTTTEIYLQSIQSRDIDQVNHKLLNM